MKKRNAVIRFFAYILAAVMMIMAVPGVITAQEDEDRKVVRVGIYLDSTYLMTKDEVTGRLSGYGYEYLQMVSNYTNWKYEYVYGEWYELWNMFLEGKIDLLEDISYMEERTPYMLFPDYAMGSERYQLYVADTNSSISAMNLRRTLSGKKVGVTAETYQAVLLEQWVQEHGYDCEIVTYQSEFTRNDALENGELDAVVELEASSLPGWDPIVQVGESDYYMALSKGNEDLLEELNKALASLEIVNPEYKQQLYFKYYADEVISKRLTEQEKAWVNSHKELRVGYLVSEELEKKSGMIVAYLNAVMTSLELENSIAIQTIGYQSYEEMMAELAAEKLDLVFPTFRDEFFAENEHLSIIDSLDHTTLRTVMRKDTQMNSQLRVGFAGDKDVDYYTTHYNEIGSLTHYNTSRDALKALARGDIDIAVVKNEGLDDVMDSSRGFRNLVVSGTEDVHYRCLSCKRGNVGLYMLLRRGVSLTAQDVIDNIRADYNRVESHYSLRNFFINNTYAIIAGVLVLASVIVLIITTMSRRKSKTFQRISETDSLTGILNRSGEKKIRKLLDSGTEGMFCLLDIDNFKTINDRYGHSAGDQVLIAVADCMNRVFRERDIVMRLGGDEFAIYVPRVTDEEIGTAIVDRFVTEVERLHVEAVNNQPIHISLGATFFHNNEECNYETIYKRADTGCYNSKKRPGSEYSFVLG